MTKDDFDKIMFKATISTITCFLAVGVPATYLENMECNTVKGFNPIICAILGHKKKSPA
jgi:hypothetical protein